MFTILFTEYGFSFFQWTSDGGPPYVHTTDNGVCSAFQRMFDTFDVRLMYYSQNTVILFVSERLMGDHRTSALQTTAYVRRFSVRSH